MDALKTFQTDSWDKLKVQTLIQAAHCYQVLGDPDKLARICTQIVCSVGQTSVSPLQRAQYFQTLEKALKEVGESQS